jgi:hypothetical protein
MSEEGISVLGQKIRIGAGYNTTYGAYLQQRYMGQVISKHDVEGVPRTTSLSVFDMLHRATSVKASRPHTLKGQNVFHVDGSDPLDIDYFIFQSGNWYQESDYIKQDAADTYAFAFCGYEESDAHIITAAVRMSATTGTNVGIMVCAGPETGEPNESPNYVTLFYDADDNHVWMCNFALAPDNCYKETMYDCGSIGVWSADTTYYIGAMLRAGTIAFYYSIDGKTWTRIGPYNMDWTTLEPSTNGSVGLYSRVAADQHVLFSDINIYSMHEAQTGSEVMEYFAAMCGMETDERVEILDEFDDALFSSYWLYSVDGTWGETYHAASGYSVYGYPTLMLRDFSASDIVIDGIIDVKGEPSGLFLRSTYSMDDCYAALVSTYNTQIMEKTSGAWDILHSSYAVHQTPARVRFVARGPWLSVFVNGVLSAWAYDTTLTSGYIGMASYVAYPGSYHDQFRVDSFYKPLDVAILRPDDNAGAIFAQVAGLYDGGHYFSNEYGALTWGVFNQNTRDLDVSGRCTSFSVDKSGDKVLSQVLATGEELFGECRSPEWGQALGLHRYESIEDRFSTSRFEALSVAQAHQLNSNRIIEEAHKFPGYPGLELCDIIGVNRRSGDTIRNRRVLGFTEEISGSNYTTSVSDSECDEVVTP